MQNQQTNENLGIKAAGWVIALLAMALAAAAGAGKYSPLFGVGAVVLFVIWLALKNQTKGAAE